MQDTKQSQQEQKKIRDKQLARPGTDTRGDRTGSSDLAGPAKFPRGEPSSGSGITRAAASASSASSYQAPVPVIGTTSDTLGHMPDAELKAFLVSNKDFSFGVAGQLTNE